MYIACGIRRINLEHIFITYLRKRPVLNISILLVYYALVTLPHEWVGLRTVDLFGHLPRDTYNLWMSVLFTTLFLTALVASYPRMTKHPYRNTWLITTAWTCILAVVCDVLLFVLQIESIHYVQYALFAILMFPLVRNYINTLIWVILAGAFDEAYQFYYLAPERTLYYDFNDVLTNAIGGGFGLCLIFLWRGTIKRRSIWKSPTFYTFIAFVTTIILLLTAGILGLYPDSNAPFILVKEQALGFWTVVHPDVTYHVVQPIEGVVLLAIIVCSYLPLQKAAGHFVKD